MAAPFGRIVHDAFSATLEAALWDAWAYGQDEHPGLLYLCSIVGPPQVTRALTAQLLRDQTVTVFPPGAASGTLVQLARLPGQRPWRRVLSRLPASQYTHALLLPAALLAPPAERDGPAPVLVLARRREDAPRLYWRQLSAHLRLPLHPLWADWLFQRALDRQELRPLRGFGLAGWVGWAGSAALANDLGSALRAGCLPVPPPTGRAGPATE